MKPKGYLALVLHAHLPFVRHPEYPRFLEEDWFYEALSETYLPLLDVFESLVTDGVPFRVTMSLTPTLLSMMTDPLLQRRFLGYLDERLLALEGERTRTRRDRYFQPVVQFYTERFTRLRQRFVEHDGLDVTRAFRRLMGSGHLEVLTCGATHGYLPLLASQPESIYAQLSMAVRTHKRILGQQPRGIWLPECGYLPGLEQILQQFGVDHFFLDTHGILNADPRPRNGIFRPLRTPAGPVAFGRDFESSKQVWSAEEGYPGDFMYREFYRDAGFDIDAPHMHALRHAGVKGFTGIKYFRITGKGSWKEPYHPGWAREQAAQHAGNFMFNRQKQLEWAASHCDAQPIVVAPYDAELFGHWWFEGPQWLDFLLRKIARDQHDIETITPAEYLDLHCSHLQTASPPECSWGAGGFHEVWLNGSNDWVYPHLHSAAGSMSTLVQRIPDASGARRSVLDQAARELLLAQSSDWAFMMQSGSATDYATKRFKTHIHRFQRLAGMLETGQLDDGYLREVSARNNLFPDMDYRIFQTLPWIN